MLRLVSVIAMSCLCAGIAAAQPADAPIQRYPDVIDASVRARADHRFDFDVTVSSPYDTPQRYADGFRVTGGEGVTYGERKLWHDHAGEQPFTRDLHGVRIPPGVRFVLIQARDRQYGYGGKVLRVSLPGR